MAAGLACALVGAGTVALLLGSPARRVGRDPLTNLTSTMPLPGEPVGAGGHSTVRFVFVAPYASRVSLVGDFNGWNASSLPMRRSSDGRAWMLDVPLTAGRHVYAFIVDGDLAPDPAAPRAGDDDFGVPTSVVLVGGGPKT
jgi:1,4-alpha-glucan branching enzyme